MVVDVVKSGSQSLKLLLFQQRQLDVFGRSLPLELRRGAWTANETGDIFDLYVILHRHNHVASEHTVSTAPFLTVCLHFRSDRAS